MLAVSMLPAEAADDAETMSAIADLVNKVYAVAEHGLWIDGAERTNPAEMAGFTRDGQIAVARLDGQIVGSVRIQDLGDGLSEFGMLAAAEEYRGIGVGRALVQFAEERNRGRTMQLELLVPREWSHPSKEFLAGWYGRIGYEIVRVGSLDELYPDLTPLLATTCDLRVYHKAL
jgi:GNAT superfamily N-acetyltransferase